MSKSYSTTEVADLRQVAEGEVIAGPQSTLVTSGINLGSGASLSITGSLDTQKTFEQLVSSSESSLARALGLTQSLASGIFEQAAASQQQIAGITSGGSTGQSNMMLIAIAAIVLAMIFKR